MADYFGGISVMVGQRGAEVPRFTGSIVSAKPVADGVEIEAVSAVSLSESIIPGMVTRGVPPQETIYVLARSSGIPDEKLKIDGLAELPRETFEVVIPIDGLVIDTASHFGGAMLLSADIGLRSLAGLEVQDELRVAFGASAYALALVTTTRMFDAEEQGLAAVDLALAWLTAQLRYGLTHRPDGTLLAFDRKESLAQPLRRDVVFVRGLTTLRQWLRRPRAAKQARFVAPTNTERSLDHSLPSLTLQDQLALLALARATHEPDALAQVQALWEAIEFYTSRASVSHLFAKSQCKVIRKAIRDALPALSQEQQRRVDYAIGQLNNAPLLIRLRKALDDDNVPIADGEIDLLWKLRNLRNGVVHGRKSELPAPEDVEYAISIVSRMVVYRVARYRKDETPT